MKHKHINIGILGVANIVTKSIMEPVELIEGVSVRGIASKEKKRAEHFASQYKNIKVFDSYEKLVESEEIDIIYIALANHLHFNWIIKAAEAKKHILVEKPLCINTRQFNLIQEAVEKNNVYIQEGIMIQHHPWQRKVKDLIRSNIYGGLISIKTNIHCELRFDNINYRFQPIEGSGVFWDSASYWMQFIQKCVGSPFISVEGESDFDGPNKIDDNFTAQITLDGGGIAEFHCSYNLPLQASHVIKMEKATITIGNFFRPIFGKSKLLIDIVTNDMKLERIIFAPENYYENQLHSFLRDIKKVNKGHSMREYKQRVEVLERIYGSALKQK